MEYIANDNMLPKERLRALQLLARHDWRFWPVGFAGELFARVVARLDRLGSPVGLVGELWINSLLRGYLTLLQDVHVA